jgi:nitrogen PTS system EIIA component
MSIADMISPETVKAPLEGSSKDEIIRELLTLLKNAGRIDNLEDAFDAIRRREDQGSTGLGDGIAVPHAKTDMVENLTLALGIAPDGVDFDSLDGQPTKIFFLLLAPPGQTGQHLEALAEVGKMAQSRSFLRVLAAARSSEEILELFEE